MSTTYKWVPLTRQSLSPVDIQYREHQSLRHRSKRKPTLLPQGRRGRSEGAAITPAAVQTRGWARPTTSRERDNPLPGPERRVRRAHPLGHRPPLPPRASVTSSGVGREHGPGWKRFNDIPVLLKARFAETCLQGTRGLTPPPQRPRWGYCPPFTSPSCDPPIQTPPVLLQGRLFPRPGWATPSHASSSRPTFLPRPTLK